MDPANRIRGHEVVDRGQSGQAAKGKPDAGDRTGLFGQCNEFGGLGGVAPEGLFGENMLAGAQDGGEYLGMDAVGQRDADRIDARIVEARRTSAVASA